MTQTAPFIIQPTAESGTMPVVDDVYGLRVGIANVFFIGARGTDRWILVDAGLHGTAGRIMRAAERLYGVGNGPSAIVLTHGHFDHVGALGTLLETWDVPVYAHDMELPYLTGRSAYPPPDPTVGGGLMAALSRLYPRGPFDFSRSVQALPADGAIPFAPGWRWVETPGHSPGHVSFFRASDRTLIAGDAVVTTQQESMFAAVTQRPELHGPPMYFTPDWPAARESVQLLAALQPEVLATGHGRPMRGARMRAELERLAENFDRLAMPDSGRYVTEPTITDLSGVVHVPPPVADRLPKILLGIGAAAVLTFAARKVLADQGRRFMA